MGIDVGTVRIGVAKSDASGILATPVETVRRGGGDVERIAELAVELDAFELIVGLPLALTGGETASTADAREFAGLLVDKQIAPVRLIDERLSTVSANSLMVEVGRSTRRSRAVIDQVSAVIILQHALDRERSVGSPPGAVLDKSKNLSQLKDPGRTKERET